MLSFIRKTLGEKVAALLPNLAWGVAGRAVRLGGALVGTALIARHLGPDRYGLLVYIVNFALLFEVIAHCGTDNIVTRELAKQTMAPGVVLGTAVVVRIGATLVAMLAMVCCVARIEEDRQVAMAIMAFSGIFLAQAFLVTRSYFIATLANRYIGLSNIFAALLSISFKAGLILVDASLEWFLVALIFDAVQLSSLLVFFCNRSGVPLKRWRISLAWGKYLVRKSAPLSLSLAAVMLHQRIDQVMLRNMVGNVALAQYAAAVKMLAVILLVPQIVAEIASPLLVRARECSEELFQRRFRIMSAALLWLAAAGAVATTLLAKPIVRLLFGAEFTEAASLVRVLAWKTVFVALSVSSAHWIIISDKQRLIALRNVAGCAMNVALNLALIPRYGAMGASVATLVSFFCASYLAHLFIPDYRPLFHQQTASVFHGTWALLVAARHRIRAGQGG